MTGAQQAAKKAAPPRGSLLGGKALSGQFRLGFQAVEVRLDAPDPVMAVVKDAGDVFQRRRLRGALKGQAYHHERRAHSRRDAEKEGPLLHPAPNPSSRNPSKLVTGTI